MKSVLSLAMAGMLALSVAHADNFTEKNTDKAKKIIDLAVEAHGGEQLLDGLETLVIANETINYSVDQSRGTEPPWDEAPATGYSAIDIDNNVFVTRNSGTGGGFENDNMTIINGDDSYQLDYRAGATGFLPWGTAGKLNGSTEFPTPFSDA